MPRALRRNESTVFARCSGFCILFVLGAACREQPAPVTRGSAQVRVASSAQPARVRRPAPKGEFDCRELRPAPATESPLTPETIELTPPGPGKTVFTAKMGVVVTFNREDFLKAAHCLKLGQAVHYVEESTGFAQDTALMDAFQMSYVVAALLDAGRASVRAEDEPAPRKSIVRDGWTDEGCAGRCRSYGRLFRLSEDDPSFFFRVTDHNRND